MSSDYEGMLLPMKVSTKNNYVQFLLYREHSKWLYDHEILPEGKKAEYSIWSAPGGRILIVAGVPLIPPDNMTRVHRGKCSGRHSSSTAVSTAEGLRKNIAIPRGESASVLVMTKKPDAFPWHVWPERHLFKVTSKLVSVAGWRAVEVFMPEEVCRQRRKPKAKPDVFDILFGEVPVAATQAPVEEPAQSAPITELVDADVARVLREAYTELTRRGFNIELEDDGVLIGKVTNL